MSALLVRVEKAAKEEKVEKEAKEERAEKAEKEKEGRVVTTMVERAA